MINKILKRRIHVDAQYDFFVQCVSSSINRKPSLYLFKVQISPNFSIKRLMQ